MPRINYTLIKMLENPGVNALLKKRLKEPGRLEGYQGITFEQVAQLAAEAGYGPETAALTYQSIKAVAKLPSDRLERLLRRRKMGQVLEFREDT
ncbi:MAG: hypothetical protein ACOX3N_06020 [Dethiobacteria bacterium]|jgi:hypothetical protein